MRRAKVSVCVYKQYIIVLWVRLFGFSWELFLPSEKVSILQFLTVNYGQNAKQFVANAFCVVCVFSRFTRVLPTAAVGTKSLWWQVSV